MMKFAGIFWHKPLIRSKKQEGVLFTVPMILSVAVLALLVLCCIFAPIISPYSPTEQNLADSLALPSFRHLLGADRVGRDLLTRLFYGGRTTLLSAVGVVALSVVIGVPLGLISGYYGGLADTIIGRICDVVLSFPSLLLAFVLVAGFGRGMFSAVVALGIVFVVNAVQDMGQLEASANGEFDRNATPGEISGGVIANNIASMIGGLLGGSPVATAGQNVGIVTTTKVINRKVFTLAAGIVALAALMPKFALILTTIPQPVLGGATITVFASIAMTGVRMLAREGLSARSMFIAGLSIALAIGIPQTANVFAGFPQWMTDIFGRSEVSIVAISSILLNLIVPKEQKAK